MVGDTITVEGVPSLCIPFIRHPRKLRLAVAVVGHTGSALESVVGSLLSLCFLYCNAASVVIPLLRTRFPVVQLPMRPEAETVPGR